MKSLIQETLWFLNMEKVRKSVIMFHCFTVSRKKLSFFCLKILPERENEMRGFVASLESKVKKVILAQHSTKVSFISSIHLL